MKKKFMIFCMLASVFGAFSAFAQETKPKVVVIPLGSSKQIGPPAIIAASINSDVTVARSNDPGLTVTRSGVLGNGDYVVNTSYNVSACSYIASLGSSRAGSGPDNGEVTVRPSTTGVNKVYIQTSDSSGAKFDLSFHLIIHCWQ